MTASPSLVGKTLLHFNNNETIPKDGFISQETIPEMLYDILFAAHSLPWLVQRISQSICSVNLAVSVLWPKLIKCYLTGSCLGLFTVGNRDWGAWHWGKPIICSQPEAGALDKPGTHPADCDVGGEPCIQHHQHSNVLLPLPPLLITPTQVSVLSCHCLTFKTWDEFLRWHCCSSSRACPWWHRRLRKQWFGI